MSHSHTLHTRTAVTAAANNKYSNLCTLWTNEIFCIWNCSGFSLASLASFSSINSTHFFRVPGLHVCLFSFHSSAFHCAMGVTSGQICVWVCVCVFVLSDPENRWISIQHIHNKRLTQQPYILQLKSVILHVVINWINLLCGERMWSSSSLSDAIIQQPTFLECKRECLYRVFSKRNVHFIASF